MRRTQYPINLWESPIDAVENLVAGLNEAEPIYPEGQKLLRELVVKWANCGRSFNRLLKKEPALATLIGQSWKAFPLPASDGGAYLCVIPSPRTSNLSPGSAFALYLFMNFLVHRGAQRLGGPCTRCHRYFVKKTMRQTVYCSRKCAKDATAAVVNVHSWNERKARMFQPKHITIAWERLKQFGYPVSRQ